MQALKSISSACGAFSARSPHAASDSASTATAAIPTVFFTVHSCSVASSWPTDGRTFGVTLVSDVPDARDHGRKI